METTQIFCGGVPLICVNSILIDYIVDNWYMIHSHLHIGNSVIRGKQQKKHPDLIEHSWMVLSENPIDG